MKKLFSIILSITVGLFTFGAADAYNSGEFPGLAAFADEPAAPVTNKITKENVTLEYAAIPYNGAIRKPAVTVKLGEVTLRAGTDYSIRFPENCTDIGKKTISISGKGSYTGSADVIYTITPLNCTNNPDVEITAENCRYNGLPQYPNVTVKYGDYVIPKDNYTITLSDNTEVGNHAHCTVKFCGNCTGERTVEFSVLRSDPEDLEIDIVAKSGQTFSIDLTSMKPAGAVFGKPVYADDDFSSNNLPKVAFNILKFTLNPTLTRSTMIAIPMTNIVNSEDYWLEFYIDPVERDIPTLVLKPLVKEYNGKPFRESDLDDNGSYAHFNGEVLEGKWSFVMPSSRTMTMPCDKTLTPVKFTPDDPQYSYVYGLVNASILRKEVSDFEVDRETARIDIGESFSLTAKGIPDDFDGNITITAAEEDEFSILYEEKTENGTTYTLDFPFEHAYHKLKVTLGGSAFYAPKTIELKIKVGNPPAEQFTDAPTTEQELSELISKAEAEATVKANKITLVSEELLRKAAAKRLTIEVRANDNITYILEPAKMKSISSLNLTTNTAVIPQVLLDKLGDEEVYSFTSFAKCSGGISIKTSVTSEPRLPIACLYLYNTAGTLEHIASVPIKGETVRFELPSSGKFVVTASRVSHIFHDFDNDCMFTFEDVNHAISLFLHIDGTGTQDQIDKMDFDGDGIISFEDINVLVRDFISMVLI